MLRRNNGARGFRRDSPHAMEYAAQVELQALGGTFVSGRHGEDIVIGIESIIIMLIVGAVAGWLAGQIVRGFGFGLLWNIIIASSVPSSASGC